MKYSSMKAIGSVEGGADAVLDALMEFFRDGVIRSAHPTHSMAGYGRAAKAYLA